ncbi:bile acid:sodium symporter family protein [Aliiroseovarius crassostreae]|uniref:bile acid:sodium symporter family protein n=1 Tax=Aliiroseovarius crassostreae TaxID=154981 RepID=UPI003C79C9C8
MTDILAKLLPLGLALLMLVVGLRLKPRDFAVVFRHPKALAVGLVVQLITLPVLAFLLGRVLGLTPMMQAGLVLVAAAPGGVTSNYIAHLARADLALSTGMTLMTTLLASVTIPAVLALFGVADLGGAAGIAKLSGAMFAVSIVPMLLGMALGAVSHRWQHRLLVVLEPVAKAIFAAMVLATFVQNWQPMQANVAEVGLAVIGLNLGALCFALMASKFANLPWAQTRAIMVEASLQNVAVAMFVAGSLLGEPALVVPGLLYAMMMNLSALVQIYLGNREAAAQTA